MRDLFNLESIRSREKDLSSYSEEEKSALVRDKKKEKTFAFFFSLKKEEITFTLFARLKKKRLSIQSTKRHAKASSVFCCCCCYACSGSEDESAKEADGGERFVGFDRE